MAAVALLAPRVAPALSFWDDVPDADLARMLVDAMTPDELIGQTLMLGWVGQDASPELMQWINATGLGGVKIFGWNGGDLIRLAGALGRMQEAAGRHRLGIPLLTATDQEGGWVRHVKGGGDLTTSITPGNMAIGASALPFDAYRSAYFIGLELRTLGINLNLAPTVDVYVNPEAHVIGPRAFSSDPIASGLLGVAYFQGLEEARVIATAKHFPGHGNASGDSHGVLPVLDETFDELWARDLVPYRFLIAEGVPVILSGHISFPNVSGDGKPASLSPYMKQRLLRETLGFDGVVVTDDLYMGGAWEYGATHGWGIEELVVEALRAGSDMVMLSRTPTLRGSIHRGLVSAYDRDPAFQDQIRAAAERVLLMKLAYLKPADRVPLVPDLGAVRRLADDQAGSDFFRDQAGRSVTLIRDERIPFAPRAGERILLAGKDPDFLRIGSEFLPGADTLRIVSPWFEYADPAEVARFRSRAAAYDTIVFCLSDPSSLTVIQAVSGLPVKVVVFSVLTPIYLTELPWVESALAVYGWGNESFRAGFSLLTGRIGPQGVLPIALGPPNAE